MDGREGGPGHGDDERRRVRARARARARAAWIVGGNTRQPAGMSEEEGEAGMGHNEERCCRQLERRWGCLVTVLI